MSQVYHYLSKGQVVTLNVAVNKEQDQVRSTMSPNWTDFNAFDAGFEGGYHVTVAIQNATFEDGDTSKSYEMSTFGDYIFASGIKIKVADDWDENAITITMTVKDQMEVPPQFKMKPYASRTAIQDMSAMTTLTLTKSSACPSSMTGGYFVGNAWSGLWQLNNDMNPSQQTIYSDQISRSTSIFYLFGPDANGAQNTAANYAGETVTQTFGPYVSTNIDVAWIKPAIRNKYPANATVDTIINAEFPASNQGTFTINSQDVISDFYSLTYAETAIFYLITNEGAWDNATKAAIKDKTISVKRNQVYSVACGGGPLQTNVLWSRWRWNSNPDEIILRQQVQN